MVGATTRARDVLFERVNALFTSDLFPRLYPGVPVPAVYFGFPVNEPPFYVAVDELAEAVTSSGGVTMGHDEITFELHVWAFAMHSKLKTASDAVLSYAEAVFSLVMADPQLNYTVDNAFASIDNAGTAKDNSKYYQAALSISIECRRAAECPREMYELIERKQR